MISKFTGRIRMSLGMWLWTKMKRSTFKMKNKEKGGSSQGVNT